MQGPAEQKKTQEISTPVTDVTRAVAANLQELCSAAGYNGFKFGEIPKSHSETGAKLWVVIKPGTEASWILVPKGVEAVDRACVEKALRLVRVVGEQIKEIKTEATESSHLAFILGLGRWHHIPQLLIEADDTIPIANPIQLTQVYLSEFSKNDVKREQTLTLRVSFNPNFKSDAVDHFPNYCIRDAVIRAIYGRNTVTLNFSEKDLDSLTIAPAGRLNAGTILDNANFPKIPAADTQRINAFLSILPAASDSIGDYGSPLSTLHDRLRLLKTSLSAAIQSRQPPNQRLTGFAKLDKEQVLSLLKTTGSAGLNLLNHIKNIATPDQLESYLAYIENFQAWQQPSYNQHELLERLTAGHEIYDAITKLNREARRVYAAPKKPGTASPKAEVYSLSFRLDRSQTEGIKASELPYDNPAILPGASLKKVVITLNEEALKGVLSATSDQDQYLIRLNSVLLEKTNELKAKLPTTEKAESGNTWARIKKISLAIIKFLTPDTPSRDGFNEPALRNLPQLKFEERGTIIKAFFAEDLDPLIYVDKDLPISTPYIIRRRRDKSSNVYTNITLSEAFKDELLKSAGSSGAESPEIYSFLRDLRSRCSISPYDSDPCYDEIHLSTVNRGLDHEGKSNFAHFLIWPGIQDVLLNIGQRVDTSSSLGAQDQTNEDTKELLDVIRATVEGKIPFREDLSYISDINKHRFTQILPAHQLNKLVHLLHLLEVDNHELEQLVYFGPALRAREGLDLFTRVNRVFNESPVAAKIEEYNSNQENRGKTGMLSDNTAEIIELRFCFSPEEPADKATFRYLYVGKEFTSSDSRRGSLRYRTIPLIINLPPSKLRVVLAAKDSSSDRALMEISNAILKELKIFLRATDRDT